uniref:Uncharacterized protein n=1 Tax=Oryza meridionalis TaxID=40149 RepID=A0A0E0FA95_9ORYZ
MCNLRLNGSSSRAQSKAALFHRQSLQAYNTNASRAVHSFASTRGKLRQPQVTQQLSALAMHL